jgi:hypothetical protein
MNRPTLIQGIGIAVLLTGFAIASDFLLVPVLGRYFAWKATIAVTVAGYLVYLLGKSRRRAGLISLGASCLLLLGWAVLSDATLGTVAVGAAALIGVVRSVMLYSSLFAVGADALLGFLALGMAAWAFSASGSIAMGLWCFFLLHALHALIPSRLAPRDTAQDQSAGRDRFARAHGAAEAAIEALIRRSK